MEPLSIEKARKLRLESVASEGIEENYSFSVEGSSPPFQISFAQTIKSVIKNLEQKTSASIISARFHNTLARVIASMAERAKKAHDIDTVVLAGGVFLNEKLLHRATVLLEKKGFNVLRPLFYSPNDESISIGQIAYALNKLKTQGKPDFLKSV